MLESSLQTLTMHVVAIGADYIDKAYVISVMTAEYTLPAIRLNQAHRL